jgi:membrane-associated protease RseP (regulator of RpoE activity)
MHLFSKLFLSVALFTVMGVATENYGGIGIAVYKSNRGVSIAGIAKNSPAYSAGLNVGDCILEVDGVSLRGKSVAEAKDMIRGTSGKPVSLKIARAGDVRHIDVPRIDLSVVNVKDKREANGIKCSNCKLLDVVETKEKKAGFYIKQKDAPVFPEIKSAEVLKSVKLISFLRKKFTVEVKTASPFSVSMYTMDGSFVKRLDVSNAKKGQMDIHWDNTTLPAGQYTIEMKQDNKTNRFVKRLN